MLQASSFLRAHQKLAPRSPHVRVLSHSYRNLVTPPNKQINWTSKEYLNQTHKQSLEDPTGFWGEAATQIHWKTVPKNVLSINSTGDGVWFGDGELNTCFNCLDVHVLEGRGENFAMIWHSAATNQRKTFTYNELLHQVQLTSAMLKDFGVESGKTVLIYMPMIPEAVITMLACARLGAVHSVVFGGFASPELSVRMANICPEVVVTAKYGIEFKQVLPYKPLLDSAIEMCPHKPQKVVVVDRTEFDCECQMVPNRDFFWSDILNALSPHKECTFVPANHPLYCLHTSGTTGKPKGVVRENGGHAVALKWSMKNIMNCGSGDVYWAASDIGWVVGHSYIVYGPLLAGCTTVLFEGKPVRTPDASTFWRVIEKNQIKTMFTAPTAIRAIIQEDPHAEFVRNFNTSSLDSIFVAGERMDGGTERWLTHAFPTVNILDNWWQTESGWPIVANPRGLGLLAVKHGSATVPVVGYDIRILDDEGKQLPPNTQGNVAIKKPLPPGFFGTIWKDHERFTQYMSRFPGYYESGDGGFIDEDGYVFITGRVDDVINCAGHRLSSNDIEEAVIRHPLIAECAVVGVPDETKGEVPVAFVVLVSGVTDTSRIEDDVVFLVRATIGAVASMRTVVLLDRLPKTRSGKILRRSMRDLCIAKTTSVPATIDSPTTLDHVRERLDQNVVGPYALAQAREHYVRAVYTLCDNSMTVVMSEKGQDLQLRTVSSEEIPFLHKRGDVIVRVAFSAINHSDKEALAHVLHKQHPPPASYIPGVEFSGVVVSSMNPKFCPGDNVVFTETQVAEHGGAFAELVGVRSSRLTLLDPDESNLRDSMLLGTPGVSAMLAAMALEKQGVNPELGEILVTDAASEVGKRVVLILHQLGFTVVASSDDPGAQSTLKKLGASQVIDSIVGRAGVAKSRRFFAAIDTDCGASLNSVLSIVRYGATIVACGQPKGILVHTKLEQLVSSNIRLIGVDHTRSNMADQARAWERLLSLPCEALALLEHDEISLHQAATGWNHSQSRTLVRFHM